MLHERRQDQQQRDCELQSPRMPGPTHSTAPMDAKWMISRSNFQVIQDCYILVRYADQRAKDVLDLLRPLGLGNAFSPRCQRPMASSFTQHLTRCRRPLSAPPAGRTAPPRIASRPTVVRKLDDGSLYLQPLALHRTGEPHAPSSLRPTGVGRAHVLRGAGDLVPDLCSHRAARTNHPLLLRRLSQTQRRLPRSPDKLRGPLLCGPTPAASLLLGGSSPHLSYSGNRSGHSAPAVLGSYPLCRYLTRSPLPRGGRF